MQQVDISHGEMVPSDARLVPTRQDCRRQYREPVPDPSTPKVASVWAVVVAAGSGARFGGAKQYEDLAGRRVLDWAIDAALTVADGVVLVVPPERASEPEPAVDAVAAGGVTRSASVRAGLAAVPADVEVVLIHDAARPLGSHALFRTVVDAVLAGADAVVPVAAVTDTMVDGAGTLVDRDGLRAVQTPQGFRASVLRQVHTRQPDATDDASLVSAAGGRVRQVQGERWNLKITEPADLTVAAALLVEQA